MFPAHFRRRKDRGSCCAAKIFALRRSPQAGEEWETGSCCLQDCIRRHAHIRERICASLSGRGSHEICFASISFEREIANGCCDHFSLSLRRGRSPSVFNHSLDPVQPRRTLSFQRLLKINSVTALPSALHARNKRDTALLRANRPKSSLATHCALSAVHLASALAGTSESVSSQIGAYGRSSQSQAPET